jgi:transposase
MTTLVDALVPDELWRLVEPLLPVHPDLPTAAGTAPSVIATAWPRSSTWLAPPPRGGCCQRASLAVARQRRRGGGWTSGLRQACSRRSTWRSWTGSASRAPGLDAGERGHHERAGQARGDHVGANPVDRGKPGSKLHLVCDGGGLPLTAVVTAANVADTTMFQAVVDDNPPVRTPSGRRRTRPGKLHADKGYDSTANWAYLRRRGIRSRIARRGIESSTRLGRHRWRVERSLSWLGCWRRLQVRWDRDAGRWFALVLVACAVICCNRR